MTQEVRQVELTEEEIRQAVNRWSEQGSFRIKYLGDKIFIDEIRPSPSFTIRLRTQYEERSVARASVPYAGGHVDNFGTPPQPWTIPVRQPADFADSSEALPIPHTERVDTCAGCAGLGTVDCSTCRGTGRVTCPSCQGQGYRERREAQNVRDAAGNVTTQWITHRDNCNCYGGLVSCSSCSGNGRKTCTGCNGSGKTKTFDQLHVRFHSKSHDEVLDATDVPDSLVGAAQGEPVIELRAPLIEHAPPVAQQADQRVAELLRKDQAIDERTARILFQHLHVERVLVHEVAYKHAGIARRLWVYGKEKHVHAPGAPWHWKRAAGIVAGVVGTIALVIIAAVVFSR